jgi:hypothetical protein
MKRETRLKYYEFDVSTKVTVVSEGDCIGDSVGIYNSL